MTALPKQRYTLEEYIELDKNSEERYEFFEGTVRGVGEVFAMAGGSINHTSSNTCASLTTNGCGRKRTGWKPPSPSKRWA